MQNLINALGSNIKQKGANWIARCPVHNDKDFAMDIKIGGNGYVIAHCHACGANGLDLYNALRLSLDELFGGREAEKGLVPASARDNYKTDKLVVEMYDFDRKNNSPLKLIDKKRYQLALARIKGYEEKYGVV